MKKKYLKIIITLTVIAIIIAASLFVVLISGNKETLEKSEITNPYFDIVPIEGWEFEELSGDTTIVKRDGEYIGRIDVYPQSVFSSSASSIVSNIYGMHAFLEEELPVPADIPDLRYCLVVDYELTGAGKVVGTKELHYIYVADDSTIIDFYVECAALDEEALFSEHLYVIQHKY